MRDQLLCVFLALSEENDYPAGEDGHVWSMCVLDLSYIAAINLYCQIGIWLEQSFDENESSLFSINNEMTARNRMKIKCWSKVPSSFVSLIIIIIGSLHVSFSSPSEVFLGLKK